MQDISQKAKSGAAWLTISQVIRSAWEFMVGIILARILSPKEFGIVAIGMIFFGLASMLSTLGISAFLIQKENLQPIHIKTSQTISTLAGLLQFIIILLISPLISSYFMEPLAGKVLSLFSINFVLNSFMMIPTALMANQMKFKKISIIEIFTSLVYGISAIFLAMLDFGVWSLVYSPIISVTVGTILSFFAMNYVPKFGWERNIAKGIIRFGGSLTVSSILNYAARNLDYFIIGKFLGSNPLGLYKRAYDLAVLPKEKIADLAGRVFFPSLCKIREDKTWARSAYLKTVKAISLFSFPVLLGFILTAPEFIRVVYGDKWTGSIKALQLIAWGGIFYCLFAPNGSVFLAYNRMKYYFNIQFLYALLLLICTLAGVKFGIEGVGIGVTITLILVWLISLIMCNRILGLSFFQYFSALKSILFVNALMFICVFVFDRFLTDFHDTTRLFLKALWGFAIYCGFFMFSNDDLVKELRTKVFSRIVFLKRIPLFLIKKG